jgi:xylose isomerase
VDRFVTLWDMAGEVISDPVIKADAIARANAEQLTLHDLIARRPFQILIGQHRGRTFA